MAANILGRRPGHGAARPRRPATVERGGAMDQRETRYRDDDVVYAGVEGENLVVESANPVNHHQAMNDIGSAPTIGIDAKLFVPEHDEPLPTVVIVPGSLGVGPNHEAHAEVLVEQGFAVCVVDPFAARAVASTVADQTLYSFAASAYDVLATLRLLAQRPELDPDRIAAQGHSRGGSAVTIAACRRFADAVVGPDLALSAVYAVYPWCGQQFVDPSIGSTRYRAIIGERDEWCSVQEVQAQAQAMRLSGGEATVRVVADAHHSFDREEPVHSIDDAIVAPPAPTVGLADDGAMIDPRTGVPNPDATDLDLFLVAGAGGHARTGASIGGTDGQPALFRDDMVAFHTGS
ncbi:MAG: dienelactone hydrolase family protein [Actinomycetota bacterium]